MPPRRIRVTPPHKFSTPRVSHTLDPHNPLGLLDNFKNVPGSQDTINALRSHWENVQETHKNILLEEAKLKAGTSIDQHSDFLKKPVTGIQAESIYRVFEEQKDKIREEGSEVFRNSILFTGDQERDYEEWFNKTWNSKALEVGQASQTAMQKYNVSVLTQVLDRALETNNMEELKANEDRARFLLSASEFNKYYVEGIKQIQENIWTNFQLAPITDSEGNVYASGYAAAVIKYQQLGNKDRDAFYEGSGLNTPEDRAEYERRIYELAKKESEASNSAREDMSKSILGDGEVMAELIEQRVKEKDMFASVDFEKMRTAVITAGEYGGLDFSLLMEGDRAKLFEKLGGVQDEVLSNMTKGQSLYVRGKLEDAISGVHITESGAEPFFMSKAQMNELLTLYTPYLTDDEVIQYRARIKDIEAERTAGTDIAFEYIDNVAASISKTTENGMVTVGGVIVREEDFANMVASAKSLVRDTASKWNADKVGHLTSEGMMSIANTAMGKTGIYLIPTEAVATGESRIFRTNLDEDIDTQVKKFYKQIVNYGVLKDHFREMFFLGGWLPGFRGSHIIKKGWIALSNAQKENVKSLYLNYATIQKNIGKTFDQWSEEEEQQLAKLQTETASAIAEEITDKPMSATQRMLITRTFGTTPWMARDKINYSIFRGENFDIGRTNIHITQDVNFRTSPEFAGDNILRWKGENQVATSRTRMVTVGPVVSGWVLVEYDTEVEGTAADGITKNMGWINAGIRSNTGEDFFHIIDGDNLYTSGNVNVFGNNLEDGETYFTSKIPDGVVGLDDERFIFNSIPIGLRNQFEETYGISYRLMYQDAYLQGLQRNTDIKNFGGGEGPG